MEVSLLFFSAGLAPKENAGLAVPSCLSSFDLAPNEKAGFEELSSFFSSGLAPNEKAGLEVAPALFSSDLAPNEKLGVMLVVLLSDVAVPKERAGFAGSLVVGSGCEAPAGLAPADPEPNEREGFAASLTVLFPPSCEPKENPVVGA